MEKCKICGKQRSEDKLPSRSNTFDFDLKLHDDDGDLARIMYHLTQDIVVSKNFSDENINRFCEKYLSKSSLSNKNLLLQAIDDLKKKLNVRNQSSVVHNESELLIWSQRDTHLMVDKCISAQSSLDASKIVSADERLSPISSITTFDYSTSQESEPPTAKEGSSHRSSGTSKPKVEFGSNPGSSSSVDVLTRMVCASKKKKL